MNTFSKTSAGEELPTQKLAKDRENVRVAIICALPVESRVMKMLFDEIWPVRRENSEDFFYEHGRIGYHHVVLCYLGRLGKGRAASAGAWLKTKFPNIGLSLVVGVCAIVPQSDSSKILLGDIIVSDDVVQFDHGRLYDGEVQARSSSMGLTSRNIESFLQKIESEQHILLQQIHDYRQAILHIKPPGFKVVPDRSTDHLYQSNYRHMHRHSGCSDCESGLAHTHQLSVCKACESGNICQQAQRTSCAELGCDKLVPRQLRHVDDLDIHRGPIASGDSVVRSAIRRDEIGTKYGVLGFEMEGAGVRDSFPTLVLKAGCDYGDSHKNKDWQDIAALNAACCAKALLNHWQVVEEAIEPRRHISQVSPSHRVSSWTLIRWVVAILAILMFLLHNRDFGTFSETFENIIYGTAEVVDLSRQPKLTNDAPIYALLGKTGVGKSSFIKTVGGRDILTGRTPHVENSLISGTNRISFYEFYFPGPERRKGYLIDTPGIDETPITDRGLSNRDNKEVMIQIRNELRKLQVRADRLIYGLLYFYDMNQPKIDRTTFEGLALTIDMVDDLVGHNGVARVTLVTTRWRENPTSEERQMNQRHEDELRDKWWRGPLRCNSRMSRYDRTKASALRILSDFDSADRERLVGLDPARCWIGDYNIEAQTAIASAWTLTGNDERLSMIKWSSIEHWSFSLQAPIIENWFLNPQNVIVWILVTLLRTAWLAICQLLFQVWMLTIFTLPESGLSFRDIWLMMTGPIVLLYPVAWLLCVQPPGWSYTACTADVWQILLPFWTMRTVGIGMLSMPFLLDDFSGLHKSIYVVATSLQVWSFWDGGWMVGWWQRSHPWTSFAVTLCCWLIPTTFASDFEIRMKEQPLPYQTLAVLLATLTWWCLYC